MQAVTLNQIINILDELGVRSGDGVLVHSAIQYLGQPQGGASIYLNALCENLGINLDKTDSLESPNSGTLAVPTFNFGFARGEPYDPQSTPSQGMGVFSEMVRQHPAARRTSHPMQSLAVIGKYADDITGRDTASAFDPTSAFDRMLELGFKILLLGADVNAISALHYSEQRAAVPYRYWKDFSGQVKTSEGWQLRTYRMFVRDMSIDPRLDLHGVKEVMEKRGQWHSLPLNYGYVSFCSMRDFVATVDDFLYKDPWSLVINRPNNP
ncbi:MAG: AAC(3) family N-acetyltransferase [Anaerolineales bacterium]|nr:AAC(3) family N-acetyltransferase [Anaerolineales bacterium]